MRKYFLTSWTTLRRWTIKESSVPEVIRPGDDQLHNAFPVVAKSLCPGKPVNASCALQACKNLLAAAEHV
jgi:hypothetical protein